MLRPTGISINKTIAYSIEAIEQVFFFTSIFMTITKMFLQLTPNYELCYFDGDEI